MSINRFIARNGLDNNNLTIANVSTPIISTDASNKSYVDTSNTALKSYTDGIINTANTFLQSNDAVTLTNAKSYTDAANNNLKSYTDGKLTLTSGRLIIGTGTNNISTLANTGTAGTYANAAYVPVITVDAWGRVSSITNTAINIANTQISGKLTNTQLANSSVTIGSTPVSLGNTVTTLAGVTLTSPTFIFADSSTQNTAPLNTFTYFTANGTYTVPANVTKLRIYAIGGGGDGALAVWSGGTGQGVAGGGGGGCAFGDITVTPGQVVTCNVINRTSINYNYLKGAYEIIPANVIVSISGTVHYRANCGGNGVTGTQSGTANTPGGTAFISGSVANGGAYSGGSCIMNRYTGYFSAGVVAGGAAAASPLGSPINVSRNMLYSSGGDGYYQSRINDLDVYNLPAGGGLSNSPFPRYLSDNNNYYWAPSAPKTENFYLSYTDPLLKSLNLIGKGGQNIYLNTLYTSTSPLPSTEDRLVSGDGGSGGGGGGIRYAVATGQTAFDCYAGNGGAFGGGGGIYIDGWSPTPPYIGTTAPSIAFAANGGMFGGGGAVYCDVTSLNGYCFYMGGNGGIGGGGGAVLGPSDSSKGGVTYNTPGFGGSAMIIIYPY